MSAFLAWVYAQAAKVYDWFSDNYYTFRQAVTSAWNWAVSQAQAALNAAIDYAYGLALDAYNAAVSFANTVYTTARLWFQAAIQYASDVAASIGDLFQRAIDYASGVFNSVVNYLMPVIQSVADGIGALFQNALDFAQGLFNQAWGTLAALADSVNGILAFFSRDTFDAILATLERLQNGLLLFLDNPLTFIFDLIWEKFISFLCFVLAHALGTTDQDLPMTPPWKE